MVSGITLVAQTLERLILSTGPKYNVCSVSLAQVLAPFPGALESPLLALNDFME